MRNLKRVSLVSLVSVALLGTMALPASADGPETAPPTVTVTLTGSTLSIENTGVLASAPVIPGQSVDIPVTGVVVTDLRAGITPWVASVALSPFKGTGANATVLTATYAADGATLDSGEASFAIPTTVPVSAVAAAVQTTTTVAGNNKASWGATLKVTAPTQALADTYTATLTHSVL